MDGIPQWIGAPALAAIIAALGYVAKLLIEEANKRRLRHYERLSRLATLQSLLLASRRVFEIQHSLILRFCQSLSQSGLPTTGPYDDILADSYAQLDASQKLMHGLIRSYTTQAMHPLNIAMIDWLAADTYYKVQLGKSNASRLGRNLQLLEAHLLLWRAKYDFWIPSKPERAIVFMDDERTHGLGFPIGIEKVVATWLKEQQ